jgi:HAD superfamily hydrolase (TIGR01490 family)
MRAGTMAIAFFDFDGTLILRDSTTLCALPSVRMGLLRPMIGLRIAAAFAGHSLGIYPRAASHRLAFLSYRGFTRAQIEEGVRVLHERCVRRWYSSPMREKVDEHRARGDRLVVATSAAECFPAPLAEAWGFDHVIGTRLRYDGDVCTGLVDGAVLDGDVKYRAALEYAQALGVPLEACAFYSDHIADLPLLERVGTPVAVGPHRPLARVARARGWPVIVQKPLALD